MCLQSPALTASHDHIPIFRGVPALITFSHQLNMAARLPKIPFTTAAPISALFRWLSLHWSSRKHEAADAGVRDRRFDRLSCMGLPDSALNRSAFRVSEDLSVGLSQASPWRNREGDVRAETSAPAGSNSVEKRRTELSVYRVHRRLRRLYVGRFSL
jgi:hypothetical protein